jgi:histidine ammonia-lyase
VFNFLDVLAALNEADVEWLSENGSARALEAGEELTRPGEANPDVFLILEGTVRRNDGTGELFGPGDVVGLVALLDGGESAAGFVVAEGGTAFELKQSDLGAKLDRDVGFAARFYRALAELAARHLRRELGADTPAAGGAQHGLAKDQARRLARRLAPGREVVITGEDLTVEGVARVAWLGTPVRVADSARDTLRRSREVVDRLAAQPEPVYGLTTNLGELKEARIPDDQQASFQRHILRSHAAGVGAEHSSEVVRAIMVTRLNGMARGGSGIQPAVFDAILAMLNAGVHPCVPMRGSIGMADLVPLAHMSLPLIGEGEVSYEGRRMSGSEGLAAAGIDVPPLAAKDGLALVSANSASVGHGALVVVGAQNLLALADIAVALSFEALGAHTTVLDPEVDEARRFSGQLASAEQITALIEGSSLWTSPPTLAVQDPISFRSAIQVHGGVLDSLGLIRRTVETELNSTGDNPMVMIDRGEMLSTGNFHPASVSIAFDTLAIALAQLTSMATNRVVRLMDSHFTKLPIYLAADPSRNVGLGVIQKTATALGAEVRLAADPASLDYMPVAGSIEDHATMAVEGVAKAARAIDAALDLLAIELIVAAQAVDLREDATLGVGTRAAYELVRDRVPPMREDRLLARDIASVRSLLDDGSMLRATGDALGRKLGGVTLIESVESSAE